MTIYQKNIKNFLLISKKMNELQKYEAVFRKIGEKLKVFRLGRVWEGVIGLPI